MHKEKKSEFYIYNNPRSVLYGKMSGTKNMEDFAMQYQNVQQS